jgi:hypothetical protein
MKVHSDSKVWIMELVLDAAAAEIEEFEGRHAEVHG